MYLPFRSETHLGDCILHAHFLKRLVKLYPDIKIDLFQYRSHWEQTEEFLEGIPQVTLLSYEDAPADSYRGWVGQFGIPQLPCALDQLRFDSHNKLCNKLGLTCPFTQLEDILLEHHKFHDTSSYETYDVLFINSRPFSNQCLFNEQDNLNFIQRVKDKNYSIITTAKVDGIDCTLDKGYSITDIGCISINAKHIVGIGTGPMIGCLNIHNKDKTFLYIDQHHYFNLPNIKMITSVNQIC